MSITTVVILVALLVLVIAYVMRRNARLKINA